MTQSPITPQILNLYGENRPRLHRPRLAAAACWLFAAQNILVTGLILFDYAQMIPAVASNRDMGLLVHQATYLASFACTCVAVLLLGIADLARGHINPWPRRCLVPAVILAVIASTMANVMAQKLLTALRSGTPFGAFWAWYPRIFIARYFLTAVADALGLIYALQIARWIRSRSLARASITVLLASLFVVAFFATFAGLETAAPRYWTRLATSTPRQLWQIVAQTLSIFQLLLGIALICYWTTLARRLGKYRATHR